MATVDDFTWDTITTGANTGVPVIVAPNYAAIATPYELAARDALIDRDARIARLEQTIHDTLTDNTGLTTGTAAERQAALAAAIATANAVLAEDTTLRDVRRMFVRELRDRLRDAIVIVAPSATRMYSLDAIAAALAGLEA